ncbi:hypothetical protein V5N11_002906 [Cardamine amara subsp. amara]|uniref:Uncharacterized protein n=1 Tax=Cardamine amara subsp. amara TaxID=228776 RepID=A0ABD1BHT0_CARAN
MQDLHIDIVELCSDSTSAVEAINSPIKWPMYFSYLDHIYRLLDGFLRHRFLLPMPKETSLLETLPRLWLARDDFNRISPSVDRNFEFRDIDFENIGGENVQGQLYALA